MKKKFLLVSIGLVLSLSLFAAYYYRQLLTISQPVTPLSQQAREEKSARHEREEEEAREKKKRTSGLEAQRFWFQMIRDPKTKTVPYERLQTAYQRMKEIQTLRARGRTLAGPTWVERGPTNIQGRLKVILVDKRDASGNTLFVGSDTGGLWKTTNALSTNPTWTKLNDFLGFLHTQGLAQNPANLNELYASTGNISWVSDETAGVGIYKSTDGGANWTLLSATSTGGFQHCGNVVINSTGAIFVATHESGVQKSTTGGSTWTKALGAGAGANTNEILDLDVAANGRLYATTKDKKVYRSDNAGVSWTNITGTISQTDGLIRLAVAPSNPNRVYAFVEWLKNYRTDDGGGSWVSIGNVDANIYGETNDGCISMEVDPGNADRVFCGGVSYHMSSNAGASFSRFTGYEVHVDEHVITFHSSNVVFFGTDGGIYRTTNGASNTPTTQFIGNGLNTTQFYNIDVHPVAGNNYYAGGTQDNGTLVSTNAGLTTTKDVLGGDGGFAHIDRTEPNVQWGSFQGTSGAFTKDAWLTSTGVAYVPSGTTGYFITPTDYDDLNNRLYSTTSTANTYSIVTGIPNTTTVTTRTITQMAGGSPTCVMVSPNNANIVYFGCDNGRIVRVTNAGSGTPAGTSIMSGAGGWMSSIAVEKGNENHIIATYSSFGVNHIVETTNGGTSWTNIQANFPDMPVYNGIFAPGNGDKFILATHLGVWMTEDLNGTATNWVPANDGLANVIVRMVKARETDGQVVAGTHGRGLFTTDYFHLTCNTTPITPYTQINGGAWQNIASATVNAGANVKFGPQPNNAQFWTWTGPQAFTATTREISLTNVQSNQTGTYTATYMNDCGAISTLAFNLTVNSGGVSNIAVFAMPSTSYISPWESLTAVNDNYTPANSNDKTHGAYGNWDNSNSLQWVQYDWPANYILSKVELYWYDDAGGVLTPTTAYLESWNGTAWVNVGTIPKVKNAFNTLNIANVSTKRIRVMMLNTTQSTGIVEWRVWGVSAAAKVLTATAEPDKHRPYSIYPKPIADMVHVEVAQAQTAELVISDSQGKQVHKKTFRGTYEIQKATIGSPGLYIFRIKIGNKQYEDKVIVQ